MIRARKSLTISAAPAHSRTNSSAPQTKQENHVHYLNIAMWYKLHTLLAYITGPPDFINDPSLS